MNYKLVKLEYALLALFLFTLCTKLPEIVRVTGIFLNTPLLSMEAGDEYDLVATISPGTADNKTVIWTTSDLSVVSVLDGKVSANSAGSAQITAISDDGGFKAICDVTVSSRLENLFLDKTDLTMTEGSEMSLRVSYNPDNISDKTVLWSSSDDNVATVDNLGHIVACNAGSAVITVKSCRFENITACCKVSVLKKEYPATGVFLDKSILRLNKGEEYVLKATVLPENATNKNVIWVSENPSVASVDDSGCVKGNSDGETVITARTIDGDKRAVCKVCVETAITGITVSPSAVSLCKGEKKRLVASVEPVDASVKTVVWVSENDLVATVDEEGEVTAVSGGTSVITVKTSDGNFSATCKVTVNVPATGIFLNQSKLTLVEGESVMLFAAVMPSDASCRKVIWNTSNSNVASVSNGEVLAIAKGTTIITAKTEDGNFEAQCEISVGVKATSIDLSRDSFFGSLGKEYPISVKSVPDDAACEYEWSSSNNNIAQVYSNGASADIVIGSSYYTHYSTITVREKNSGLSRSIIVCNILHDFTWTEQSSEMYLGYPLITIAVGETHQLQYTCTPTGLDNIFENISNLVFYELSGAVDQPSVISIDENGFVKGMKVGIVGIKPTGALIRKNGGIDRVYRKVIDCYEEKEPNNDFPYATTVKTGYPIKFSLSSISDVDVFKFTNPTSGSNTFAINLNYTEDGSDQPKVLRWELYNDEYQLMGSGTFRFDEKCDTYELSKWINTKEGYLKYSCPPNYSIYPEFCPTSSFKLVIGVN